MFTSPSLSYIRTTFAFYEYHSMIWWCSQVGTSGGNGNKNHSFQPRWTFFRGMLCCLNLPYCVCSFQYRWDVQVSHVWRFCQPRRSSTSCSFELWENDELFFWALRDCECCHFSWPLPRTGGRFHRQDLPKGLWIWKASFFLPVGKETVLLKTSPPALRSWVSCDLRMPAIWCVRPTTTQTMHNMKKMRCSFSSSLYPGPWAVIPSRILLAWNDKPTACGKQAGLCEDWETTLTTT